MSPPGQKVSNMLLGKSRRQLLIAPGKNEAAGPKQKWRSAVGLSGDESKMWCCKEQYCIGNWNVRSMNQGKLDVVKQEVARVNTNILGISEWKWMGRGKFNLDGHYIYYSEQESLRRSGVALIVNKSPKCSSVQFSRSVVSYSLWPQELQHTRPPCPSPTPGVYSNSCPSSPWCHLAISFSVVPFSSCPQSLPASESFVFSNESTLRMRWPKYWSFSFSIIPSKEILGLISFRMDWLDLLAVQGTLKSLLQHHSSKAFLRLRSLLLLFHSVTAPLYPSIKW